MAADLSFPFSYALPSLSLPSLAPIFAFTLAGGFSLVSAIATGSRPDGTTPKYPTVSYGFEPPRRKPLAHQEINPVEPGKENTVSEAVAVESMLMSFQIKFPVEELDKVIGISSAGGRLQCSVCREYNLQVSIEFLLHTAKTLGSYVVSGHFGTM